MIDITSTITNTGKDEIEDLSYSLYFSAIHRYYFSPFQREKHPDLNFRVYQKKGHYLGWLNLNPLETEEKPQPGKLTPGKTFSLRYILLTDVQSDTLLRKIYKILNREPIKATIHFEEFQGHLMEVVIKDAFSSSIFFRSFLEKPLFIEVPLPKGIYQVRANFFPSLREEFLEVTEGGENFCTLKDYPQGVLKIKIRDSQEEFVPGKVTFIGLQPTKTPYFAPENPVETGRSWETFKNSCYPQKEGLEVRLPVGTYLVYASRGPEYTLDKKVIEVLKGEEQELVFQIDRVVKTPNLISLDPHMHTQKSDGRVTIPERIKSIVAEGVEIVVASDHNYISDYSTDLERLGLKEYLTVIPGAEVTNPDLIHFNTFALHYSPDEENNGAIFPLAKEVSSLFKASRQKNPEAILQVNHARLEDIGYFNNFELDPESAAFAGKNFDTTFDVLEVMNGPFFTSSNSEAIEDWFHLLNRGYFFPITGSSDSHSADKEEPGYSRTYILYPGKEGEKLDWPSCAQAIKKGRSLVSNGPLLQFKVNDRYSSGDSFSAKDGEVNISISVQSAPWVSVDEVRIVINGERKIIFPVRAEEKSIQKFEEKIGIKLRKDSYILAEVLGKRSLYPVLQQISFSGEADETTLPYAITNPVFIDVDGNGKFDPLFPEKIRLESMASEKSS